ncbi:MAG: 16S rRNA (guanine(527)-N(7))-methyltransferase RsmG [Actinomycetaceae bacterium]|nr:16S rRNA (guanine(527)-N(7))-methyltransferase RsmG [Actinomycetaceae bacterium]
MLRRDGEKLGLLGPREYSRLWTRHIINSTVVSDFISDDACVADVGSGAGFPGIVLACIRDDIQLTLIDKMRRRTQWLERVVNSLQLSNVNVFTGRSLDFSPLFSFDVVTARAVASVKSLLPLTVPLVKQGGHILAMKGQRVSEEIDEALPLLRKKAKAVDIHTCRPVGSTDDTYILDVRVA